MKEILSGALVKGEKLKWKVERLDISRVCESFIERLKKFDKKLEEAPSYKVTKRLLQWLRVFLKLGLFLLAPAFFVLYGVEIVTIAHDQSQQSLEGAWYYWAAGCGLIIMGCLVLALLPVAYFSGEPSGETTTDGNGENASGIHREWVGAALISVDVISVGIIYVLVLLAPLHEFRWPPLRTIQNQIHHLTSDPTIASINGVTNNADEAVEFIVRHNERGVSIRAIGEEALGKEGKVEWVDGGWIENAKKKEPVWMMSDGKKTSLKERTFDHRTYEVTGEPELPPGLYVLRYQSDGSDSVNLCAKEKHKPYSDLEVTVLSRQNKDKKKESPPVFSSCLKIMVTVKR